jgi:hypothetical protein
MPVMESPCVTHTDNLLAFNEDADTGFGDNVSRDVLATRVRRTYEHAESWTCFCVNSQEI